MCSGRSFERHYTDPTGHVIARSESVKDLGIVMSDDGRFGEHIAGVVRAAKMKLGWILRTFKTREETPLMFLYSSLVRPLLEYSCQLWNPSRVGEIQQLESVQRSFTARIRSTGHLDYWQRLARMDLYSLQRRRERYIIVYVFKVIEGLVPNLGGTVHYSSEVSYKTRKAM